MSDDVHGDVLAAIAGIDDFLERNLPAVSPGAPPLDGSVHVHTTDDGDVHGEWLIVVDDEGRYVVTREHAKGSCALRGRARDLLDVLWRRQPVSILDVVGDTAVAQRFVDRTALD